MGVNDGFPKNDWDNMREAQSFFDDCFKIRDIVFSDFFCSRKTSFIMR